MNNKSIRRFLLVLSLFLLPASFQPLLASEAQALSVSGIEKININSADISQLSLIKGIGEKKAQAIIDYRTINGEFTSLDDLANVKGIGESTLQKIMPYLTL